jgi:hypothetical protein
MLDGNNKPEKIDIAIREYWVVKFYNRLSGKECEHMGTIPHKDLEFIMNIPYEAMISPFVKEKKMGRGATAQRFNIGVGYAEKLVG